MGGDADSDESNVDDGQLDAEVVERLLDGDTATRGASPVAELLMRAAAPGRAHELAREDDIVLAFRAANRRRFSWRRLLTFKFFGAFLAAVTAGGLAFASGTGIISTPWRAVPPSAPVDTTTNTRPEPEPTTRPSGRPTDAELHGLCKAYLEKTSEERGKALPGKAFARLVDAAGGADRVDAYCASTATDTEDKDKDKDKDKGKPTKTDKSRAGAGPVIN